MHPAFHNSRNRGVFRRRPAPRWAAIGWLLATIAGCGDGADSRQAAYQEAQAALERHETTLANILRESGRLRGEYRVYLLEADFLTGNLTPAEVFDLQRIWPGLDRWTPTLERVRRFTTVPTGFRSFFLLWKDRFVDLPWYDRLQGQILRQRSLERYAGLLNPLDQRRREEETAVRNAADYARLLAPQ